MENYKAEYGVLYLWPAGTNDEGVFITGEAETDKTTAAFQFK